MLTLRRLLFIAVLATYVAGLGVSAAGATAMAGAMAMGVAGEMGDCQGCDPAGGDEPASACDIPCLTPMVATLVPEVALWAPPPMQASDVAGFSFGGRTSPPDPSPPRSLILS